MEFPWASHIRSLAKKQQREVVDAVIDKKNHLVLKTRDGANVDAGLIKDKPHGTIAYIAYSVQFDEPDIYVTKDGMTWVGATSAGRFASGTNAFLKSGCWTGDRFLVPLYQYLDNFSCLLQSRDGGTWSYHPDLYIFNFHMAGVINGMDSDQNGFVVAVGDPNFGAGTEDANVVFSYDFGETWHILIPYDEDLGVDLQPFSGDTLYAVCVKNRFEWVVSNNSSVWYTVDGGKTWDEVDYPIEFNFNSDTGYNSGGGIRYFNGCWWFFGYGTGEIGPVLIKSEDFVDWTFVTTPWDGNYSPMLAVAAHDGITIEGSGIIYNLECDIVSNTMIATGYSAYPGSYAAYIMMSTDGGDNWFEIGNKEYDYLRTDYGFDGVYNLPFYWSFDYISSGMACGFGSWYVVNSYGYPDQNTPTMIKISLDGKASDVVYPPYQLFMNGYILLSGGDLT